MPRLPYLSKSDLAEEDRDLLARDINLHRLLAHSPAGARAFTHLSTWIRYHCALDARLRELLILQIGYCSGSDYEFSHHIHIGHEFGVSDKDVSALMAETRGGDHVVVEGSGRQRNVVLEFPSYQEAVDCYHSPEYQDAKALRDGISKGDLVIIEGYDIP